MRGEALDTNQKIPTNVVKIVPQHQGCFNVVRKGVATLLRIHRLEEREYKLGRGGAARNREDTLRCRRK